MIETVLWLVAVVVTWLVGFFVGIHVGTVDTERRWSETLSKAKWNWENRGELPGGWRRR